MKNNWEKEFEKIKMYFCLNNKYEIGKIKDFIQTQITKVKEEALEEVLEELPKERKISLDKFQQYIERENGAFNYCLNLVKKIIKQKLIL